ncbi:Hypothetical protein NTJ_02315 [Nesidiocoris tenuis]|nr:Hypothetical protein NTJ_02315 [Nesidiocoris tenuis]
MYYVSHLKTRSLAQKFVSTAVRKVEANDFNSICTNDMGIFCVSLFRCSVPVDRPAILKCIHERFTNDIDALILDNQSTFVSMVKCFRLSKYYNQELVHFIASQGLEKLSNLDIVAKIHLAVYFAVCLYGDVNFISSYYKLCIRQLSDKVSIEKSPPRLKEFDNLLWSCASFNLKEVNEEIAKSKLPEYVSESLCLLRRDLDTQIALLSSLWACEIRLEKDIVRYISPENVKIIKDSPNFKSRATLYQLLTCVHLESPNLLKPNVIQARDNRLQPKYDNYMSKRPQLKKLLKQLQDFGQSLGLKNIRFSFEVPALYIGGVSAEFNGSPISVEVIDQTVCLTNSLHLSGKMKLKLRLLERMGRTFVLVPGADSYNSEDLGELLMPVQGNKVEMS